MSTVIAIARRECMGLFYSPIAYVVLFIFLAFMGLVFGLRVFNPGTIADMRDMFDFSRTALFLIVPLTTMSLLADEHRSGRIEVLRTSPITEGQLVLGKFLGAWIFYCALLATTLLFLALLAIYGRPDYGAVVSSYIGMILMGGLFVAVGLFFSACTQNQIVAAMSAILTLLAIVIVGWLSYMAPGWMRDTLKYLSVGAHFDDFSKGVADTRDVIYFLSGTVFFVFLSYRVLESRKWR